MTVGKRHIVFRGKKHWQPGHVEETMCGRDARASLVTESLNEFLVLMEKDQPGLTVHPCIRCSRIAALTVVTVFELTGGIVGTTGRNMAERILRDKGFLLDTLYGRKK